MQARARNDLARMFAEELDEAGLETGAIDVYSTPRRLALIARDVAEATEAGSEEIKGPRTSAPPQALEGFLRKTGLTREQLEERDGVLFAVDRAAGRGRGGRARPRRSSASSPTSRGPSRCAGATATLRWVRPLHGIVALLGEEIVPVEIDGIASGATTRRPPLPSSRARSPSAARSDYVEKLRACHVIVDQDERERLIRDGAAKAAARGRADAARRTRGWWSRMPA